MSRLERTIRHAGLFQASVFEDWLSEVVTQLVSCRHLLYTRAGVLFGFRIGWHVYTREGHYVGSFRNALGAEIDGALFSATGHYLGERDPDDEERLAVNLARRTLRLSRVPELPALPGAAITLSSVREPLLPRDGWHDFPSPDTFAPVDLPDGDVACSQPRPRQRVGRLGTIRW